jgi:hypothetical protein
MGRSSASSVHPLAERVNSVERLSTGSGEKEAGIVRQRHEWMQTSIYGSQCVWVEDNLGPVEGETE